LGDYDWFCATTDSFCKVRTCAVVIVIVIV
jgi:hypothetical protein